MTTGNDLVSAALRLITSLQPGEAIDGQEADTALGVLNSMMKSWSASSAMPAFRTLESFPLVQGKNSYTIGPGADFDTVRPDAITYVYRRDINNLDITLPPIPKETYNAIGLKNIIGAPWRYYYDTQYPNGVIYIDQAPSEPYTLFIESLKPMNQFTTLQTVMVLPGEYEETITFLLARRLAPQYGYEIQPGSNLADLIETAERMLKSKNAKPKPAIFDVPQGRCYGSNIYNV